MSILIWVKIPQRNKYFKDIYFSESNSQNIKATSHITINIMYTTEILYTVQFSIFINGTIYFLYV